MSFIKKYFFTLLIVVAIIIFGRKFSNTSGGQVSTAALNSLINSPSSSQPQSQSPSQSQSTSTATPSTTQSSATYKDGTYTGSTADAYYGNVQVQVTISGGKISNINFLSYPNDNGRSQSISSRALPQLRSEVITAQSASVNAVSGASFTSQAFVSSLSSALSQAS